MVKTACITDKGAGKMSNIFSIGTDLLQALHILQEFGLQILHHIARICVESKQKSTQA